MKHELLAYQEILLRGSRILVPKAVRDRAVDLAHVGHQELWKLNAASEEKFGFPVYG